MHLCVHAQPLHTHICRLYRLGQIASLGEVEKLQVLHSTCSDNIASHAILHKLLAILINKASLVQVTGKYREPTAITITVLSFLVQNQSSLVLQTTINLSQYLFKHKLGRPCTPKNLTMCVINCMCSHMCNSSPYYLGMNHRMLPRLCKIIVCKQQAKQLALEEHGGWSMRKTSSRWTCI